MNTQYNEWNKRTDKHAFLGSKLHKTLGVPLAKVKMASLPVVQLTPNFLKMCVIKFDLKSGCIKAKIFFSLGAIIKKLRGGANLFPPGTNRIKMRKCVNWDTCLRKEVYCNSNVSQTGVWGRRVQPPEGVGVWGEAPSRWTIFRNFLEKKVVLIPLDHICTFSEPFESTRFLTFENQLKKLSCLVLLLLAI